MVSVAKAYFISVGKHDFIPELFVGPNGIAAIIGEILFPPMLEFGKAS